MRIMIPRPIALPHPDGESKEVEPVFERVDRLGLRFVQLQSQPVAGAEGDVVKVVK
jgi:hypothetical protein